MFNFISKFGLGHCDLTTMMWNVSFMLRALTLNIETERHKGIPIIFYVLTIIATSSYTYVYVVSMIWFVFWRCMETGDLLAALIAFSQGTAGVIGPVKLIYMLLHITKIRKIVKTSLASDALVVPGTRLSKNLRKTLRIVKRRAIVFWITIMSNGVVYLMRPFLTPGRQLTDDHFIYYGLEPMYETPNYEIALTVTILGILFTCYITVNITAFVIVNVGYVEAQMQAWSEELLHLWEDAGHHYAGTLQTISKVDIANLSDYKIRDAALNKYVNSRLKEIISRHAGNLDLLQQIESVFRTALVIELFILITGLLAALLGGLENTYMEVPFSFIQVAMDCLTGQRLADASEVFQRAVFECRWENFDRPNMKLVLLMLQSSQKTMTLSAGGMSKLNFSYLMSVVRSLYSAYTTLRPIML